MKSIANQYRDLKEGKMSQQNFMRNLRMTMPQYVTNVTSFGDAVKILKNKSIIVETTVKENFDFNKSAIESATGDKISHTEEDDFGETIYWSTENPYVNYYIGSDEQIIKYDGKTGERYIIGDLRNYDEPSNDDYEPDTDADYEEPRDDFDMAGDYNDGEFWEGQGEGDEDAMYDAMIKKIEDELASMQATNAQYDENKDKEFDEEEDEEEMYDAEYDEDEMFNPAYMNEAKPPVSKEQKIQVVKEWIWYTCDEGTNTEDISKYNKMVDIYFADKDDVTYEDFKNIWNKVTEKYGVGDVSADWDAFPETWKDVQSGSLVNPKMKYEGLNEAKKPNVEKAEDENLEEVTLGIFMEHACFPDKSYEEIEKIVKKNVKKNPNYYTNYKLTGIRDYELQTMDSSKPEDHQMKFYTEKTAVDTARGMQKVKMPKKEEKKKLKESKIRTDIKGQIVQATNNDGVTFSKNDDAKAIDNGEKIKITGFKEEQGKIKALFSKGMFASAIDIDGLEKIVSASPIAQALSKEEIEELIREVMNEYFDGRDNLINPLSAEDENN
jgi:hypothetical protein